MELCHPNGISWKSVPQGQAMKQGDPITGLLANIKVVYICTESAVMTSTDPRHNISHYRRSCREKAVDPEIFWVMILQSNSDEATSTSG